MKELKDRLNGDLIQILFNIVIIGVFSIVDKWLLFSYGSWGLAAVFEILMLLMCCLLAINVYSCMLGLSGKKKESNEEEKQMYALLYRQMKKLENQIPQIVYKTTEKILDEQQLEINKQMEELKINQLRSVKALLNKMEQTQSTSLAEEPVTEAETPVPQAETPVTEAKEPVIQEVKEEMPAVASVAITDDPNRELSADEIALLFAEANS
ncbi:MAG: hypothetical protein HFI75_08500 [Lachnospiraceae bacterium]|nr:hypothetical protein [Lachnospiraceae bacterium]